MTDLTAILLCGGKGERLKPFTDSLPKAMVRLNGEPLLSHLLRSLSASGIKRFVICVGYRAEAIEEFVNKRSEPEWQVFFVDSGEASMTRRIEDARAHLIGPALICYGDTLANVNLKALRQEHEASGALATLTVYPMRSPFGVVAFDAKRRINSFTEKPSLPYWINIGFLLCEPEAFSHLNPRLELPDFLSSLAEAGALYAYQHEGKHLTVNTEKERADAEGEMIEFFSLMDEQRL